MEILDFIIRGRSVLAQDIAALYGGESGVSTLRFTGADASKSYKLDLLNEWNGQKNVLDLQNDGGTLSVALTGAASIPAGGYQMQLRTVGETVWHSDPVRLTVRTPIDAVEAFDPNVPSEMRQLEQRATEAAQTAASVRDMTVSAETLPAGSAAGVEKTLTDGALHLTFSVPRGADGATPDISGKMDKSNPTGTGALSVNRLSGSTVGDYSAALGESTVAQSRGSVAVGRFTYATTAGQFTCGVYSKGDTNQVFIVGWGSGEGARKNVFTVSKSGTGVFSNDCLIGTRSLKAVPVVFRICDTLGYSQTHTLFCAAGHTWADMIAGSENPVVRYVYDDNGTTQYANATLLRVQQGIVQVDSLDSSVNVVSWKDLYTDEYFENAVQATDTPQDGATYYINNE